MSPSPRRHSLSENPSPLSTLPALFRTISQRDKIVRRASVPAAQFLDRALSQHRFSSTAPVDFNSTTSQVLYTQLPLTMFSNGRHHGYRSFDRVNKMYDHGKKPIAHCALQDCLNKANPSGRFSQNAIRKTLNDKSSPVKLLDTLGARRKETRSKDASRRRGLPRCETNSYEPNSDT